MPFEKHRITEIVLVVIFAPISKNAQAKEVTLKFSETCQPDADIAVHLFTIDQFSTLLTMLDTLPDFLLYLNARWVLHRDKIIPRNSDPMDEWAFITFERPKLLEVFANKTFVNLTGVCEKHTKSVPRLEEKEKPSYLIDRLIEFMNQAIGHPMPAYKKLSAKSTLGAPNSREAYQRIIPYLAKLDRQQRCQLAEQFLLRVGRCKTQPLSFGGLKFEQHEEAYVVLASKWSARNRQMALYSISVTMGHKLNVRTVIGIAGTPEQPVLCPSEAMIIDTSTVQQDDPLLVKASKELLGSIDIYSTG